MAVEVLACALWWCADQHAGRRSGRRAGPLRRRNWSRTCAATYAGGCGRFALRAWARCRRRRRGCVPVHPSPTGVEQDGPADRPPTARSIPRPTAGGRGIRTTLVPLPHTRSTRWPCSSPRSAMLALVASKMRRPSSPSIATRAKSDGLTDSRLAVSMASNCRCVKPRVGDSGGMAGRRTCSAGEWSSAPSITAVRRSPRRQRIGARPWTT